jgi:tetratricopeptide (TPR) repeat protein
MSSDSQQPPDSNREQAQINALADEFRHAWTAGGSPRIEEFLAGIAENDRAAAFRVLLDLEVELRRGRRESVSAADYLQRFPGFDADILAACRKSDALLATVAHERAATPKPVGTEKGSAPDSGRGSSRLEVRCPSCQTPMKVAADTEFTELTCSTCGSHFSLVSQSHATRIGPHLSTLGRFELVERIGVGGFGSVWKARDKELDRTVAIKLPRQGGMTAAEQEKFLREARAAAQLRHPNIVSVHEVGRDGDSVYIVSDFVRGVTLGDWLTGQQPTSREAAQLCAKIADALHHAHEQGIVHRDLKPANIMIDGAGEPHLMDFGLARREVGEVTVTLDGQVLGTPAYMSPEQAQGEAHNADRRSDVYSLGVVLYQLLTGELPFRGNARMLMHQVINEEPASPRKLKPGVPRDLETICLKCLCKEKERRYASAHELAQDLRRYLNDEPIAARPVHVAYKVWRKVKRNRATSFATAAAIISALGGITFYALTSQSVSQSEQTAKRAQQALERVRGTEGIRQLAVLSFRNLSGDKADDWLSAAFATVLETKLSEIATLKVVANALVEDAAHSLGLQSAVPLVANDAQRLGNHLLVNHLVLGEYQRLGDQIQVSARIVNVSTGAIDQGGMRAQGKFPDEVFDLQADLAAQCIARLGVGPTAEGAPVTPESPADAVSEEPAASVEAWVLFGQGQHALRTNDYEEAIRLLSQAVQVDPQLAKAYRALGQAYQQLERSEDALAAFNKALEMDSNDLVSRAYLNLLSGRVAEGLDALDQATKAGVADLDVLKISALVRLAKGMEAGDHTAQQVIDDLKAALEKHPADDELWITLATCYGISNEEKLASDALEKAVEVKPESFRARLYLALRYDRVGRAEEAQQQFAEAERFRPKGPAGHRAFGTVFLETGQIDRAIKELQRALEIEPANGNTHLLIGQAYGQKLDLPNSVAHFEKALADQPKSTLILSALCRLTNLLQDNTRLIKYATQWADADPQSYEAHQYLRIAYLKTGQQDQAAAEAKLLAGLTPMNESFFVLTGNTLIQAGIASPALLDEANAVLAKGYAEFPQNKVIYALLKLTEGMKRVKNREWHRAIDPLKKAVIAAPHIGGIKLDCAYHLATCYMETGQFSNAAEEIRKLTDDVPRLAPVALEVYKRAKRYDYTAALVEKAIKTNPTDAKLQESLIDSYVTVGRWDDARSFVNELPATTADECQRRIRLGAVFADQMELRNRFDAAEKQTYLDTLMQQTRDQAKNGGVVKDADLDAQEFWLDSSQPWLVAGPFSGDRGLDGPLPPETRIEPLARYRGVDSAEVGWRVVRVRPGNPLDLLTLYPGSETAIAYAVTYIHSPDGQPVTLRFAGRDLVKVWLGDKVILQTRLGDQVTEVKAAMNQGATRLLIKTIDRPIREWSFAVSAVDADGAPARISWSSDEDVELGAARALAHRMRERFALKSEVIDRLRNDASISSSLRERALELAGDFADEPHELNTASWEILTGFPRDARDYALALRQAEAACQADKTNWIYLTTLGTAQYRVGQDDDAVATLNTAQELCRVETGSAAPTQLAVAAMAHHRLGNVEESQKLFVRLNDLMRGEGWARDIEAQKLFRDAKSVLKDSVNDAIETRAEIDAIKSSFVAAEEVGRLHRDLESHMKWWAEGGQSTLGRGDEAGPYDVTLDRQTLQAVHSLMFQGVFRPITRMDFEKLDVELSDNMATLRTSTVLRLSGGYETWNGIFKLRKKQDGWKAVEGRRWTVSKKLDQVRTDYDVETWKRLDAKVEDCRAKGDLRQLAVALADAYRLVEAHRVLMELTSKNNSPASDWVFRGRIALGAGKPSDTIASFKQALSLDPKAAIPQLDELIVAGPAPP